MYTFSTHATAHNTTTNLQTRQASVACVYSKRSLHV